MKINFKNKAARLKLNSLTATCQKCPFRGIGLCSFGTLTAIDCNSRGWWVDGESLDIFKI